METVSNIATAAAKAVWGDSTTAKNETSGQEPISGQQGDVSQGEPFDKGNADLATQTQTAAANTELPDATPTTELSPSVPQVTTGPTIETTDAVSKPTTELGQKSPQVTTGSTTDTVSKSTTEPDETGPRVTTGPTIDTTDTVSKPTGDAAPGAAGEFAKTTGTAAESEHVPDNEQTALKAHDAPQDSTAVQNDTRAPEDPQTHPKNAPTDVDNTGTGPNEAQNLDGPGPKPLDQLAHERGGDAGKTAGGAGAGADEKKAGDEDVDPNDPKAPSSGEGTGEKHVKTTGFQADGGDFDATKPGAGREADRLLEEKGIHKEGADKPSTDVASGGSGDKSEEKSGKKNPFSKLKEKLHKH